MKAAAAASASTLFPRVCLGASATLSRLPRSNLLLYRDNEGATHPVRSAAHWELRRAEVLRGMHTVMGPLPGASKRCSLDVEESAETDCASYIRKRITYASEPGSRTPSFLLIPKKASATKPAPCALALHPTDLAHGHKTIVGLAPSSYAKYAVELAERGWIVIAPAYPLMADYQPDLGALGYDSGTMKAIWDNVRAVDYLETLSIANTQAVAAIGHSLGGHNAIYTAVLEPRIRCVVSSCGFDSFLDYYDGSPAVWERGKGWVQNRYMPRLANYAGNLETIPFDFHELIGALAPRPCFVNAPQRDSNFRWRSVAQIAEAARKVYDLHKAGELLRVEHPDAAHEFPDAIREKAYTFMAKTFQDK